MAAVLEVITSSPHPFDLCVFDTMKARIKSICIEPNEGGSTTMAGGINALVLPAGYLGSSLIGALLVFVGFDTNAVSPVL